MNQPNAQKSPNYVTCLCQHCSGKIEFDADQLDPTGSAGSVLTGQTIACPHCGLDTILFVPHPPKQESKPAADHKTISPPKIEISKTEIQSGNVNRFRVQLIGAFFFALTVLCLVFAGLTRIPSDEEKECARKSDAIGKECDLIFNQIAQLEKAQSQKTLSTDEYLEKSRPLLAQTTKQVAEQKPYFIRKKELSNGRDAVMVIAIIAGCALSVFWIPATLYLFLVRK